MSTLTHHWSGVRELEKASDKRRREHKGRHEKVMPTLARKEKDKESDRRYAETMEALRVLIERTAYKERNLIAGTPRQSIRRRSMTTLTHHAKTIWRYLRDTRAVSALEYAILVGAVAAGLGTAVVAFRQEIVTSLTNLQTEMTDAVSDVISSNT